MSMNARQTVKLLLAAAVFVVVFRMLLGKGRGAMDRYENEEGNAFYDAGDDMYFDAGAAEEEGFEDINVPMTYDGEEEEEVDTPPDETYETYAPLAPTTVSNAPMMPSRGLATGLLPQPAAQMTGGDDWSEFAPKDALKNQNFLDATKFIGVNTQGSSLKNANYDLRSSMPIPKADVGPWSGSSIDPDLMRRPLE